MPLSRLTISNLRNLRQTELQLHPHLNLIYGENGSGKTSLLEAVSVLGLGRSFRSHRATPLINYEADKLTVFAELKGGGERTARVGVEKSRQGETEIRVDGQRVTSAAELAMRLPVVALNAGSFELVTGPPKPRRQFLDWLAFHVEPRFFGIWRDVQHCLKQRNSLIRRGRISGSELEPWDRQLSALAPELDRIRSTAFTPLLEALQSLEGFLPDVGPLKVEYRRGWRSELAYGRLLADSLEQDVARGHTQSGPHRADLRITVRGESAAAILSRGQQKVLAAGLMIAQAMVFRRTTGREFIFLVDDLPAELDEGHCRQLGSWLDQLGAQALVTGVERNNLVAMWPDSRLNDASVFHVEQGCVLADD